MKTRTAQAIPQRYARVAGFLYLLVVPLGILSLFISSRLVMTSDGAATVSNLIASASLFRLGIVSDLLASLVMLLVVFFLYEIFKSVDQSAAFLMVVLVMVAVPIAMFDQLNHFAALQLVSGADYLKVFTPEQLQTLVLFFLRLNDRGAEIAFLFWGLWLFPLGYLVFKSGFLPRMIGVILMVTCLGYPLQSFASFLGYSLNIGMFAVLGEVVFILWLLIKGIDVQGWEKHALESV
jgi:hypothetical protein